jgi:hypothetical protein
LLLVATSALDALGVSAPAEGARLAARNASTFAPRTSAGGGDGVVADEVGVAIR